MEKRLRPSTRRFEIKCQTGQLNRKKKQKRLTDRNSKKGILLVELGDQELFKLFEFCLRSLFFNLKLKIIILNVFCLDERGNVLLCIQM